MKTLSVEATAVVAGSFKPENLLAIQEIVGSIMEKGINVLAPRFNDIRDPNEAFVVLDTDDPCASPRELESAYMEKIAAADVLVLANHRWCGRIGLSVAAEIAHARLSGTPIVTTFLSKITDLPDIYFSDEVTAMEQQALSRIDCSIYASRWIRPDPEEWRKNKRLADPLPSDHPDHPILSDLRDRLLDSLPTESTRL